MDHFDHYVVAFNAFPKTPFTEDDFDRLLTYVEAWMTNAVHAHQPSVSMRGGAIQMAYPVDADITEKAWRALCVNWMMSANLEGIGITMVESLIMRREGQP